MLDDTFSVLIVCTANQCRSPTAELLLAQAVAEQGLPWRVSSAGTRARPGEPIHPRAARALRARGISIDGWRGSRQLTPDLVDAADLILVAASMHRRHVVTVRPNALPRAFLFREFVRLRAHVSDADAHTPDDLIDAVARMRSHTVAAPHGADDIADPIGRRQRAFTRCCTELASGVLVITRPNPAHDLD